MYEREDSAILLATHLTSSYPSKITPVCNSAVGSGKTFFVLKFRTVLKGKTWPGKSAEYDRLESAIYLQVIINPLCKYGSSLKDCMKVAMIRVRDAVVRSCRCHEEDLPVSSMKRFLTGLSHLCEPTSTSILFHFDDAHIHEAYGSTAGVNMLTAMLQLGSSLRNQGHYFVMTGHSALLHSINTRELSFIPPDSLAFIPLPPLSVHAVSEMIAEFGVDRIADQAEQILTLTAGVPGAVCTVVQYCQINPAVTSLQEHMAGVESALRYSATEGFV